MSVVVVGLNHRSVPLELLERMNVSGPNLPKALHDLGERTHLSEVVVLSTCMRTEVFAEAERFHGALADVRNFLSEWSGAPPEAFSDLLYSYFEDGAVSHLFTVAAGLDSAVIGEGEILGQVRDAWHRAREEGAAGPVMARLFRHALEVGKRARTETSISRGVTSVSQAAVAMASSALGGLAGRSVLVLGAGEMGEGMAVALGGRGVARITVASRTGARAEALAARLDGVEGLTVSLGELESALPEVDVVLSGTGAPGVVLGVDEVRAAQAGRAGGGAVADGAGARGGGAGGGGAGGGGAARPLLIVDIAVPRDVDPAVREIEGVRLLDMDDLVAFTEAGVASRRSEIDGVRAIVAEEVERFGSESAARTVAPVVAALHERAEVVRSAELERLAGRLGGLDERQREAVEALTRGLVAKLLHAPTVRLKDEAGTPRGERLAEAVQVLFDLEE